MDYNVADIFEEIELDLIRKMKKSLGYHFKDEKKLDINYNQWQVEQLKALEEYKRRNPKLFKGQFSEVNKHITDSIRGSYKSGKLRQEKQYLEAIKKGYKAQKNPNLSGAFFKVNDKKLESLVKATTGDMAKAESSILRRSGDLYRQTILKTQTYLNLGSTTLDEAIDMATHDFLAQGINSIKYSNGRMVNIRSYSEMALRTANTRAQLMGEGAKRQELGETLVKVSSYGECSETCLPYQGLVYIDDVYSSGKKGDGDYPLLSEAMNGGLFHPNCRHTMSTYYEGISTPPHVGDYDIKGPENPTSNDELNNINANIRRYKRLKEGSLHPDNIQKYTDKLNEWQDKLKEYNVKNGVEPKIPKKVEPVIIDKDSLPEAFYKTPKQRKQTDLFIDKMNSYKDADPKVKQLYKNLNKMESIQSNGLPFEVKYGKSNKVQTWSSSWTGELKQVEITMADLNPNDMTGFNTCTHEMGHLIDLELRSDITSPDMLSDDFKKINEALEKSRNGMGDKVKDVFDKFEEERKKIQKEIFDKANKQAQEITDKLKNSEVEYKEYSKTYDKIYREANAKYDVSARACNGGNINSLEDIYDALSKGMQQDMGTYKFGHGRKYYFRTSSQKHEIIANYMSLSISRPDLVKLLKEDKPELVKALEEYVDYALDKINKLGGK